MAGPIPVKQLRNTNISLFFCRMSPIVRQNTGIYSQGDLREPSTSITAPNHKSTTSSQKRGDKMRRALFIFSILIAGWAPLASAQEHGQVGVFADYVRLGKTETNFAGLGGRLAFNANRYVGLEAEMGYDFNQAFTEGFTDPVSGSVTLRRSNLRILHGLFGPTLQTGHGPIRAFITVKGGFMNFRFDPRPATFDTFASSVQDLRASNVNAVLYPGGGLEGHLGPIGLRFDVGDEIYFNSGAHHNLRVAFGPMIRF
jgi:hypothetical protein